MPATYVHLSGREIEPALLAAYGIGENQQDEMKERLPRKCSRCGEFCACDEEFCHRCGNVLTVEAAVKANEASMESLVRRFEELERLVRTSQVRTSLENTILNAISQVDIFSVMVVELIRKRVIKGGKVSLDCSIISAWFYDCKFARSPKHNNRKCRKHRHRDKDASWE